MIAYGAKVRTIYLEVFIILISVIKLNTQQINISTK